jgi:hypothetical protein
MLYQLSYLGVSVNRPTERALYGLIFGLSRGRARLSQRSYKQPDEDCRRGLGRVGV